MLIEGLPKSRVPIVDVVSGYMLAGNGIVAVHRNFADAWLGQLYSDIDKSWGFYHEVGHTYDLPRVVVAETTVNIFSLALQRYSAEQLNAPIPPRTKTYWPNIRWFMSFPLAKRDFNSLGVFEKLCMYQQLWLAAGTTTKERNKFYTDLFILLREEAHNGNAGTGFDYFYEKTSEVMGYDLKDFYRDWGITISDTAHRKVAKKGLPFPPFDFTTLEDD